MTKYFIIANGGGGLPTFIVDDDDNPLPYNTGEEAEQDADKHQLCIARGYEILEWDYYEE